MTKQDRRRQKMAPVTNQQKRFLKQLSDQLTISDVGSMKFVCRDRLGSGVLEKVNNEKPYELFTLFEQKGIISAGDMSWLRDVFTRIQRSDLASRIPVYERKVEDSVDSPAGSKPPPSPGISPYRTLLKTIADELTTDQVDEIKFLLGVPSGKSGSIQNGESLLLYMENCQNLSDTNLTTLKECLADVHRNDLIKKVEEFSNAGTSSPFGRSLAPSPGPPSDVQPPANEAAPPAPSYLMKERPFGYALIINNETFEGTTAEGLILNKRTGTQIDLSSLKDLWERLGFVVESHTNLKAATILTVVQDMVKKINEDQVKPSCFVCCIMTHGREGDIYGTDSKHVHFNDITGFFKEEKCPALAGKPKLFFIQACRGQNKLRSLHMGQQEDSADADAVPGEAEDESFRRNATVDESHFLLGYSTLSGYVSWRSSQHGTWYVSSLVNVFSKHYQQEDVVSMMIRVNGEVSEAYTKERYKQCPAPVITLTKRVYFLPSN